MQTYYEEQYNMVTAFNAALEGVKPEKSRAFSFPSWETMIRSAIIFNVFSTLVLF